MKQEVLDEGRLAGASTADENRNRILRNVLHLKLPEGHAHRTACCHVYCVDSEKRNNNNHNNHNLVDITSIQWSPEKEEWRPS